MRKTFVAALAAIAVSPITNASVLETAGYPENNPAFTVEVPIRWQAKREQGALKLIAQAEAVVLVQRVDNIKDEATAKEALPKLAELEGQQFQMRGMMISAKPHDIVVGDFKGFTTQARGTDSGGHETLWQSIIFSPNEADYYLVTALWTAVDAEETADDRAAIFNSLKRSGMR